MKVVFLEGAHQDLVGSADYFVDIDPRLATRFLDDVEYGVNMFRSSPQNGKMVDEFRLIPLQMFPFNLVYIIEPNEVVIVAVAHQRRRPNYWDTKK